MVSVHVLAAGASLLGLSQAVLRRMFVLSALPSRELWSLGFSVHLLAAGAALLVLSQAVLRRMAAVLSASPSLGPASGGTDVAIQVRDLIHLLLGDDCGRCCHIFLAVKDQIKVPRRFWMKCVKLQERCKPGALHSRTKAILDRTCSTGDC